MNLCKPVFPGVGETKKPLLLYEAEFHQIFKEWFNKGN